MAMQPQADTRANAYLEKLAQVAKATKVRLRATVRSAYWVVCNQDARSGLESLEKPLQALQLLSPHTAGRIPEPPIS